MQTGSARVGRWETHLGTPLDAHWVIAVDERGASGDCAPVRLPGRDVFTDSRTQVVMMLYRCCLRMATGFVLFFCLVPSTNAHPFSVSYSHWKVESGAVRATIRLPADDMDLLLRLDADLDGKLSDAELERAREPIGRYLFEHVRVASEDRALEPVLQTVATWKDEEGSPYLEVQLSYSFASESMPSLAVTASLLTDLYPDHRTLAEIQVGDRRTEFVFQHGNTVTVTGLSSSRWTAAMSFVTLGFDHILTGYDHILFLLGLLLVARGLRQLAAIVTSFTVAHSLTLSLATLGILEPTMWTIEAAIALSIAYVGVENLVSADTRHRWKIAFVFGLLHGFGFASVLREMELPRSALAGSLLTFNIGVEIGQLVIVTIMFPVLRLVQRTRYGPMVTRYGSLAVIAMGLYWFCQRVLWR